MPGRLNVSKKRPLHPKLISALLTLIGCLPATPQTPSLAALLAQGQRAFNSSNYTQALKSFEEARKLSSDCAIPFFIGVTRYRLKQIDEAIVEFSSASACNPSMPDARIALAEAYAEKGDDNRALASYQAVLKLQPDNVEALRASGKLCLRHEMNIQAVPLLERLVQLQPADPQAKSDLAAAYAATGKFDQAEKELNQAFRIDPENASVLVGLGAVYLRTNRIPKALPLLQKAATLVPNDSRPFFLLGSAYNRLGKYREAVTTLEQAARLSPNDADIYYQLASACEHAGRSEERRAALQRFAELKEHSEKASEARREAMKLLLQAKPLVDAGKLQEALGLVEKAQQLYPENDQILYRLASLYYDAGQYESALQCVRRAISLAPSEWAYHDLMGLIQERIGNSTQARDSLEIAIQLNPESAEIHNQLGRIALKLNDPPKAIEEFKQAVALDPEKAVYKLNLEAAYRAANIK